MSFRKSLIVLVLVSASYSIAFLGDGTVRRLTVEDGAVETVGAFFFLAAALVCFVIFRRNRRERMTQGLKAKGEVIVFLLALFFLLCFLEEISWGQRYLGVQTPELLARFNRQSEINIHNLPLFHGEVSDGVRKGFLALLTTGDRLFSVFWLGFGVAVPLLNRYSKRCQSLFSAIGVPVLPICFSVFFVLNYVLSKSIPVEGMRDHPWVEIKEANCAFLLMLGSICLLFRKPVEDLRAPGPGNSVFGASKSPILG